MYVCVHVVVYQVDRLCHRRVKPLILVWNILQFYYEIKRTILTMTYNNKTRLKMPYFGGSPISLCLFLKLIRLKLFDGIKQLNKYIRSLQGCTSLCMNQTVFHLFCIIEKKQQCFCCHTTQSENMHNIQG